MKLSNAFGIAAATWLVGLIFVLMFLVWLVKTILPALGL